MRRLAVCVVLIGRVLGEGRGGSGGGGEGRGHVDWRLVGRGGGVVVRAWRRDVKV